jgi:thiamine pyrophosphate-dependent acetolactate synthase large subunit-like protein
MSENIDNPEAFTPNFPYDGFIPDGIQIIQVDSQIENIGRRAPVSLGLLMNLANAVHRPCVYV